MFRRMPLVGLAVFLFVIGCRTAPPAESTSQSAGRTGETPSAPDSAPRERWNVTGRITDASGSPIAGVEVWAHCGAGTLFRTGQAVSDANGEYDLRFAPGLMFETDSDGLQAATISPHKSGMIERNLHRQGDLLMANRTPDEESVRGWGEHRTVVLPSAPVEVDFVMIAARTVRGRLLNSAGEPIVGHTVYLDADELPPSSSVLAGCVTDEAGRFEFAETPPGDVWISLYCPEDRRKDVRTGIIRFGESTEAEIDLTYAAGPPPALVMDDGAGH